MTRITDDWLTAPPLKRLFSAFGTHEVYLVGGVVRNSLLGREPSDFDLATPLPPHDVTALAEAAGLRVIPTGIDHGTVTVLAENVPFEVTTFRSDVNTDGRHAEVAFGATLEEDAQRRDFTMNAVYAARDGTLIDPTGGIADLEARRVRFIGDAAERIKEDYLRILRFFRFHADVAGQEAGIDPDGLAACADGAEGLERLSSERVTEELRKLLLTPNPSPAFAAMVQSGVAGRVLPGSGAGQLSVIIHLEDALGLAPGFVRRLYATGGDTDELRLSKADRTALDRLSDHLSTNTRAEVAAYRHGETAGQDVLLHGAVALNEVPSVAALDDLRAAASAVFPVSASDLMPALEGVALGQALKAMEERWVASGFTLSREDLMIPPN